MEDFQLEPPTIQRTVVPIEPIYSMLHDAPIKAVEYLHAELSRYEAERELDDMVPNMGMSRRKALEQTMLVLNQRKHSGPA